MFGPPRPIAGQCNAELRVSDDYGDNCCTFRCSQIAGHAGEHFEIFRGGLSRLSWSCDDRSALERARPLHTAECAAAARRPCSCGAGEAIDPALFLPIAAPVATGWHAEPPPGLLIVPPGTPAAPNLWMAWQLGTAHDAAVDLAIAWSDAEYACAAFVGFADEPAATARFADAASAAAWAVEQMASRPVHPAHSAASCAGWCQVHHDAAHAIDTTCAFCVPTPVNPDLTCVCRVCRWESDTHAQDCPFQ